MKQYLDLLKEILNTPLRTRPDRTGTGVRGVFGRQLRFMMSDGFPVLTTKKLHLKSIICELLWMLKGDTNIHYLNENGVTIWDEWANEEGELGPVYGKQWRSWPSYEGKPIDQIATLISRLKSDPYSRRHVVSAWNVAEIDKMVLPPCHCLFQFYVSDADDPNDKKRLSLQLYQRSGDIFLGVPFNIASYALLLNMVAQVCDYEPYEFVYTLGDVHLYENHVKQAQLQCTREPFKLPKLHMDRSIKDIDSFTDHRAFYLTDYKCHPHIKADISV